MMWTLWYINTTGLAITLNESWEGSASPFISPQWCGIIVCWYHNGTKSTKITFYRDSNWEIPVNLSVNNNKFKILTFIVGLFRNRYCKFFADQCNIIGSLRYSLHTSTSANKNEVIITEKALLSLAKTSLPDLSVASYLSFIIITTVAITSK